MQGRLLLCIFFVITPLNRALLACIILGFIMMSRYLRVHVLQINL
jgi:hypothetical protein